MSVEAYIRILLTYTCNKILTIHGLNSDEYCYDALLMKTISDLNCFACIILL